MCLGSFWRRKHYTADCFSVVAQVHSFLKAEFQRALVQLAAEADKWTDRHTDSVRPWLMSPTIKTSVAYAIVFFFWSSSIGWPAWGSAALPHHFRDRIYCYSSLGAEPSASCVWMTSQLCDRATLKHLERWIMMTMTYVLYDFGMV